MISTAGVVGAFGPVGILVNAAGVCAQELMTEARDETWATVLDINLTGAYRTTKRCLPAMLARRLGPDRQYRLDGLEHGLRPARRLLRLQARRCSGLARCVALEGAAQGVTCNTISPGTVATGLTRIGSSRRVRQGGQGRDVEENLRLIAEGYPQKRLIETERDRRAGRLPLPGGGARASPARTLSSPAARPGEAGGGTA